MPDEAPAAEAPAAEAPAAEAPAAEAPVTSEHPDVRAMEAALTHGDFQGARDLAAKLQRSDDPALRAAGDEMRARFTPDPVIVAVMAFTGALMLFLAAYYLGPRR